MYKLQIEQKHDGSLSERTFIDFKKCFESFQIELRIRDIEKFSGFGIPRDEDIEDIGFGLLFHGEGKFQSVSILKTATGKEVNRKNPFLRTYNGRMENLIHFIYTEGGREFLSINIRETPFTNPDGGLVKFFHMNNQVVGIVERSGQFEIVFSRHFETFGEAISAIEKHFAADDTCPEEERVQKTIDTILQLTTIVAFGLPSIVFFTYLLFIAWKQ
jgi:hypothetical protein